VELISDPKIKQRLPTVRNVLLLVDRIVREVKDEEERRLNERMDKERRAMKQQLMKEEARQMIVDAISSVLKDHLKSLDLESAIGRIVTNKLTKFLTEKNIDNRIDVQLEELVNEIKSSKKREAFLPDDEDVMSMYKCLPKEILEKMPIYTALRRCRELMGYPLPFNLEELKKMRENVREALSELIKWKSDNFVHVSDLEKVTTLKVEKINEELSKAGFPKCLRTSEGQEIVYFYVPVEPSCTDEVKKVETELLEKIQSIEKQIADLEEQERKRKIEEYRRAEMISRPY
jgi:hypothetical protein